MWDDNQNGGKQCRLNIHNVGEGGIQKNLYAVGGPKRFGSSRPSLKIFKWNYPYKDKKDL